MSEEGLSKELKVWREAYDHLREAYRITATSKAIPLDDREGFRLVLRHLLDDCEDLGDIVERRIENQKPKQANS